MNIRLTEQLFRTVAEHTVFHHRSATNRTFRSFFGCNSGVATFLWNRARRERLLPGDFTPKHMLWTLAFIKLYETEAVLSGICGCDEKTFRKWVWKGIDVLFDLDLIDWENRYMREKGSVCLVTVGVMDFKINKPTPFSDKWFSCMIDHAGLRYEIGICLQTGWLVWVEGPYPPGRWSDLAIARNGLHDDLDRGELYLADGTYRDRKGFARNSPNGSIKADQRMKDLAGARLGHVKKLLNNYGILHRCFRHHRTMHGRVLQAVANVVQATLMME